MAMEKTFISIGAYNIAIVLNVGSDVGLQWYFTKL